MTKKRAGCTAFVDLTVALFEIHRFCWAHSIITSSAVHSLGHPSVRTRAPVRLSTYPLGMLGSSVNFCANLQTDTGNVRMTRTAEVLEIPLRQSRIRFGPVSNSNIFTIFFLSKTCRVRALTGHMRVLR